MKTYQDMVAARKKHQDAALILVQKQIELVTPEVYERVLEIRRHVHDVMEVISYCKKYPSDYGVSEEEALEAFKLHIPQSTWSETTVPQNFSTYKEFMVALYEDDKTLKQAITKEFPEHVAELEKLHNDYLHEMRLANSIKFQMNGFSGRR